MNWIYEAPGENINREEYLLGKKVDKYVDPTLQAAEREKHLLATTPGALFAGASVNATVDLENKIREDPLFEIKKREQEAKKRLANNPVKLKQLRALVEEVKGAEGKKKKKRKHKHKGSESDDVPEPIRSKSKPKEHSSKQQQQRPRTGEGSRTGYKTRHRSRSPVGNDRQYRPTSHRDRSRSPPGNDRHRDRPRSPPGNDRHYRPTSHRDRSRSPPGNDRQYRPSSHDRSRSPPGSGRQYRPSSHRDRSRSPPGNDRQYRPSSHRDRQDRSHSDKRHRHEDTAVSKRLTQEELEQKRREMMSNAEWHAGKRGERVRQHRIEEEQEERERQEKAGKQEEFVDPLMAESLADATAGTLGDRIHRKIGSVQRTRAALENSFTRK